MAPLAPEVYERLKMRLKRRLADIYDIKTPAANGANQRQALTEHVQRLLPSVLEEVRTGALSAEESRRLVAETLDDVVGLGPLEALLADPAISEIMVNGPQQIFIERQGKIERFSGPGFRDTQHLLSVIERLLSPTGVAVNEAEPCADASLPDGARVNVVLPPVALNGPTLTIRKQVQQFSMHDWVAFGSISPQAAEFLAACVQAHLNIVISGGTSSGKTTLVSILSKYMRPEDRVITIENVAELELPNEHWVRLVARSANAGGRGEVSLRTLVKNALRMRPDRIVLGEARGGEALDVVQAMLTGHDGVITVLHGNSPLAALERLQTLMLMSGLDLPADACRRQVAAAVHLVVHLSHFPDGGRRVEKIVQISGVTAQGFELEELFVYRLLDARASGAAHGLLEPTGVTPRFADRFRAHNVGLTPAKES